MGHYFKYILFRIGIGLAFLACCYVFNSFRYTIVHDRIFDGVDNILVGDSHFNGFALNNSIHLGQDSEVYYTMLQKIKTVNSISNINNVVISYSYLNFSKNYFDDFLLQNDVQSYSISSRNYPLAGLVDQWRQSRYKKQLLKVLSRYNLTINSVYIQNDDDLKRMLPFMWHQDGPYVVPDMKSLKARQSARGRKLDPTTVRYKNQIAGKIERLFVNEEEEIADVNIKYLDKILEYCHRNSTGVILVSTPLESYYASQIPEYLKEKFNAKTEDILSKYDNVKFLDFTHEFTDSEYFIDEHHVTGYGAALLSKRIESEF